MYLWHVLSRDESELISRVYRAQECNSSRFDWFTQVHSDLIELNITLSDVDIQQYSKNQFKCYVDKKILEKRKSYLLSLQSQHSKSKYLCFGDKPSEFLSDPRFTRKQVEILLALRAKNIETKENFKNKHKDTDMWCILCRLFSCTTQHILDFPIIRGRSQITYNNEDMRFEMVYGDISQQIKITQIYEHFLAIRDELLKADEDQSQA